MKKNKGFTLIELLIVMSVIAILISIALPSFKGMQNAAKRTQAKGDLNTLKIAIESYYSVYGSYPDSTGYPPAPPSYQNVLYNTSPQILDKALYDPFVPGNNTYYGYEVDDGFQGSGADSNYYVLFSVGPKGDEGAIVGSNGVVHTGGFEGTPSDNNFGQYNDGVPTDTIWVSNGHSADSVPSD